MALTDGLKNKLKVVANAIRSKTNKSGNLTLEQMASEVSDIDTLQGLNFEGVFDQEQANEINQYYKDGIAYAKQILTQIGSPSGNMHNTFRGDGNLIFAPNFDYSKATILYCTYSSPKLMYVGDIVSDSIVELNSTFWNAYNLKKVFNIKTPNVKFAEWLFRNCYILEEVGELDFPLNISMDYFFQRCFLLKKIKKINVKSVTNWINAFNLCEELEFVNIVFWKQGNITFDSSTKLSTESIHYIIQNAVDVADGATARTIKLHATAKTNWQNSEYYEQDLAVLSTKGITIA